MSAQPPTGAAPDPLPEPAPTAARRRRLPHLPLALRVALHLLGWVVLALGVAGLVLPGLQGILTIVAGAAILSVASDRFHSWLHQALGRWPRVRERLDRFRQRLHDKLSRRS